MANSKRPQEAERLPNLGFTIRPTFLDVREGSSKSSSQAKGVLEKIEIRRANAGGDGDIKLRLLSSNTYSTHSDLLRKSGYDIGQQPIMDIMWDGMPFSIAARYTARSGKRGPVEIALMMAGITGSVESARGYNSLRSAVALSCGIAVVKQEYRRSDPSQVGLELNVINDFMTPHQIHSESYTATNLIDLAAKLG